MTGIGHTMFQVVQYLVDYKKTEEKMNKFALKYYPSEEVIEEMKKGINGVQLVEIEIEHISGKKIYER